MSVLRPLDKQPGLNTATILLVGTEDALLQQLADAMLQEDCASELKIFSFFSHLTRSLPLPSDVNRPRIDLIMFVVNLHSKYSLQNVEESLRHVDATFFLGKVGFLAMGAGQESHCSIHRNTITKLANTYRSPLFFCDLEALTWRLLCCACWHQARGQSCSPYLTRPHRCLWAPAFQSPDEGTLCWRTPHPHEGLSLPSFPCLGLSFSAPRGKAFEPPWRSAWYACCRSALATCPASQP
uniref:centromere protein M isoform X1 n=3 Tax=Nyctereutes procyonoides TaxID=34880 RepID=UPI00244428B5|nr:centromere protein M isoform X1 [Nyctereutes procyonoides]